MGVEDRAERLRRALLDGDIEAVRSLCTPDHWARSAAQVYEDLAGHVVRAETLGILGRRSLLQVQATGWRHGSGVFELLWHDGEPALVDDPEETERLATKLAAQDAAQRLVDRLVAHDEEGVEALFDPASLERARPALQIGVAAVRRAELVGSVGPRTLVRVVGPGDQTIEYLWRASGDDLRIAGARVFGSP
jgi:hypothetical protein